MTEPGPHNRQELLLQAREQAHAVAPVFPVPGAGPLAAAHALLDEHVHQWQLHGDGYWGWSTVPAGGRIRELGSGEQADIVLAAVERVVWSTQRPDTHYPGNPEYILAAIARDLLREEVPLRLDQRARLAELVVEQGHTHAHWVPLAEVVRAVVQGVREPGADAELRPAALRLHLHLLPQAHFESSVRALADALEAALLGGRTPFLNPFEPWGARVADRVDGMGPDERARWMPLLEHLLALQSATPSARWARAARAGVAAVGEEAFRAVAAEWIGAMREGTELAMYARNADFARGMAWCLAGLGTEDDARLVGDLALLTGTKIPGIGQRSPKVMNGCIAALGEMPGDAAMAQITRLRARVKYVQAQALIEKALLGAAQRRGCSPGELEELAAPLFGMDEPGVLREQLDGWTAEVRVTGTTSVASAWISPAGARQKGVPAALKGGDHGEALKAIKKAEKEIPEALAAQRARLEALATEDRDIPYPAWRERYVDHPLLAEMCRRLFWRFRTAGETASGGWLNGEVVDAGDRPLRLDASTQVRPWHPIDAPAHETEAWRAWLERHGVTQPFKQAHREVYRLTDAERDTLVYSTRFAGHILRQHQMAALARGRGWRYQLMGQYDRVSHPTRRLPAVGLSVELEVEPVEGGDDALVESGVSRYVTTGQVRFLNAAGQPISLEGVPPLAFSEAMRDVDLFVGVSSVGTDPTWADGGTVGDADYWREFAFGPLSVPAGTRRQVLERLLPRLRIAAACTLEDRFLVVRGSLRTYRIHLGSGNVLMEPGSAYLCIVPDRSPTPFSREAGALRLPFEGDALLSLILSKAFLLAADNRITDLGILQQIRT